MDFQTKAMESVKKYLGIAATAMLARTIINEYLPNELRIIIRSAFNKLFGRFSTNQTIIIYKAEGLTSNKLYEASSTYLCTRISPNMRRFRVSKSLNNNNLTLSLVDGEVLIDDFQGVQYKWKLISKQNNQSRNRDGDFSLSSEVRYELTFHKKYNNVTLDSYLPHILEKAKEIKAGDRRLKLYMNEHDGWNQIDLQHPATFETLAMEADLKKTVLEDLTRFVQRKEYYKKIGRAWKRGYLLFGPPGTGKSTFISAMANYLRFDIYDLNLMEVRNNSGLKRLLVGMKNKSMLVIEDIDCSIDFKNRDKDKKNQSNNKFHSDEISLSGLLNFIDGLWSTSGEERIIVFTTNYKEKLDPALLRPGRMDMHIHMGYCGPNSFRILVSNYHAIDEHPMFEEIEGLLKEVEATPAEVAEQLLRSDNVDVALEGLIQLLVEKKEEEGLESSAEDHETNQVVVGAVNY